MTDFEKQQLKNLSIAIRDAVEIDASWEEKRKIILDGCTNDGDITLLCEFLAWFEE